MSLFSHGTMEWSFSSEPPSYNLILLGKTGAGKSASGNTILGRKAFISKKSFKSVTQEVQMERVTLNEGTFNVYDTPGLFNTETSNENIMQKWCDLLPLDQSDRSVILMVMKATRFTPEEKQAIHLMVEFLPKSLLQNTWVLFSRGDELEREHLTIHRFIEETPGIKEVLQRFQNRYHVFNNVSPNPNQVPQLARRIRAATVAHAPETPSLLDIRIVLLGKTGSGKSATGNTILGEKRFRSRFSTKSVTSKSEACQGRVEDRNVCVIDTPGLFNTSVGFEETAVEIGRSIYVSSPGPHAFLIVLQLNRFTDQEKELIQLIELLFGKEVRKYATILFTHGDQLEGENVEDLIKESEDLSALVQQCGGGYHVFNNKDLNNREQVSELMQKIDRMVERNGGTCYSNEMFEETERLKQEEVERMEREKEERRQGEEAQRLEEIEKVKRDTEAKIRQEEKEYRETGAERLKQEVKEREGEELMRSLEVSAKHLQEMRRREEPQAEGEASSCLII